MRLRCTILRLLLTIFGLLMWARPSAAQKSTARSKSAVVVIDAGTADLFIESLIRSTVETELPKHGYEIVTGVSVGGDTPATLLACSGDLACASAAMKGIAAQYVVFLSLRSETPGDLAGFKIIARSFEVDSGRAIARIMRRCTDCVEDIALASFTEAVVRELVNEVQAPQPASEPAVVVGPVYDPPVAPVAAAPTMSTATVDSGKPAPINWNSVAKYTSLGFGVAALTAGTVLVLVDGPVIEDGVRQPQANDTLAPGFVSLGTGAVLVGLSAWLWSRDDDPAARSLVLQASDDAASFVYAGAF